MDNLPHKMPRKALFVNAICLLSLIPIIKGADPNYIVIECPNTNLSTTSTYAPNSTYRTNLNTLLSNLSSNSNASNGFYKSTAGSSPPDIAYGLFLCRGDVSAVVCRDCVVYATGDTVQRCPGSKQVTIWYDECMLRYSNESMTPSILSVPGIGGALLTNTQNVTNATRLNEVLEEVMTNITDRASSDDSGKKFATAEANYSSVQSVYGLAQCTPDLSDSDCNNCLRNCISQFPSCCDAKRGGRVLFRSCNVRYEMYLFYNASAAPLPPSPVVPPPPGRKGNAITIGLSVSASVVLVLLGSGIYCQRRRKRIAKEERENNQEVQLLDLAQARIVDGYSTDNLQGEKPAKSHDFPSVQLDLVLVATKHFSEENKLGEGGFGPVYKGTLPDGKEIAVKRLSRNSGQGLQEFKNEISLIARLQHRNLVQLLGCCLEGNELMLIYEYMPNKSLDFFLFDSTKASQLDWKRRFLIISGIARGLLYLHEDSRLRIIHRDLKVSNILLDQEMNPKISDFGMARIFGGNQSEANTNRVVGTYGYMAPEYAMEGLFSVKSDVFSFGVLLLEIISGKKNSGFYLSEQGHSLLTYAWNIWCKGEGILELMDPLLAESCVATEVLKCIHVGLLCVQEDPADRPTMSTVVVTLGSDNVTLPQPTQPAFSVGRLVLNSCQSSSHANEVSGDEMTISDVSLDPKEAVARSAYGWSEFEGVWEGWIKANCDVALKKGSSKAAIYQEPITKEKQLSETFEGLKKRFLDDIMQLSKEQIDAEDAEMQGIGRVSMERQKVEKMLVEEQIKNIIACDKVVAELWLWSADKKRKEAKAGEFLPANHPVNGCILNLNVCFYDLENIPPQNTRSGSICYFLCSAYAICLLSLIPKIEGADPIFLAIECPNTNLSTTSTYAPNSTYKTNLNTLFSVLSSNSTVSNGFHESNAGSSVPDIAYGLFLCRGDVSATMCRDCVVYAIGDVVEKCPWAKQVTIWYDICMLRYSNVSLKPSIFSAPETGSWYMWNLQNVTNVTRLNEVLEEVMPNITDRASSDHSGKKFATAEANYSLSKQVYGLAQCTPDLSDYECNTCLRNCILLFPNCCAGKVGGRMLFRSCNIRYEMYSFYNASFDDAPLPPSPVVPPPLPPPPPSTTTTSGPGKNGNMITIGVSVSASIVVVLLGFGIYYQRRRKRTVKEETEYSSEVQLLDLAQGRIVDDYDTQNLHGEKPAKSQDFPSIQLDIILVATKQFSEENKLGEGGFGPVYKGTLPDGKEIAVKRLSRNSGQGLQEFKNEISLIARLQHRNLVRLLGFCLEGNELMLIYEYMPNKSLDFFLFDSTKAAELDWKRRFLIINGIARGLLYLHEDSRLRIIHRDLKVSNILLDREMNPKISDFGMARIFGGNQSEANTNRVVGTYGYMAPEYAMEGLFSVKSDVFSFGVLLLEIISRKRNNGFYLSEHGHSLLTYAWNLWCKGEGVMDLMDPLLVDSCVETEVLKCIHLGLLCVQEDPADRPTMSTIVITLGSDSATLPKPTQPAFSVGRLVLKSCQASPNANLVSANGMTISDVSAR
ncbi:uncharacterized protein LOC131314017 [Rhododendron vialii]|uniref:uncharacterized protein LOC131314017 n=1 Tax=Rhododendron vialii TaxID=182163 RepID=UPI00265E425B|nr:uncharacterized protein LOC131314017 [Rhododendron vialii]